MQNRTIRASFLLLIVALIYLPSHHDAEAAFKNSYGDWIAMEAQVRYAYLMGAFDNIVHDNMFDLTQTAISEAYQECGARIGITPLMLDRMVEKQFEIGMYRGTPSIALEGALFSACRTELDEHRRKLHLAPLR